MSNIAITELENGISRLIIQSGRGNPITPDFVADFNATMDQLLNDPPRVLIIDANGASIFSGGFALESLHL